MVVKTYEIKVQCDECHDEQWVLFKEEPPKINQAFYDFKGNCLCVGIVRRVIIIAIKNPDGTITS